MDVYMNQVQNSSGTFTPSLPSCDASWLDYGHSMQPCPPVSADLAGLIIVRPGLEEGPVKTIDGHHDHIIHADAMRPKAVHSLVCIRHACSNIQPTALINSPGM